MDKMMLKAARHLRVIEESKDEKYKINKKTKLKKIIQEGANIVNKYEANLYALSLGYKPNYKIETL